MDALMKKIKADMMAQPETPQYANHNDMMNMCQYIMSEIDYVYQILGNHMMDGHLPKVTGAEQMTRAVKALGLDKEYDVQQKVIYAKNRDGSLTATITLKSKDAQV